MNLKFRRIAEFRKFKHRSRSLRWCSESPALSRWLPAERSSRKTFAVQISNAPFAKWTDIVPRYTVESPSVRVSSIETIIHPGHAALFSLPPPFSFCLSLSRFLRAIIALVESTVAPWKANFENYSDRAVAGWNHPLSRITPFHVVAELPTLPSCEWRYHAAFGAFDASGGRTTGMSGRDSRVSAFDIPYCASAYQQVRPVDSPFVFIPRTRTAIQNDRQVTQNPPITSVAKFDYNIRAPENRKMSAKNYCTQKGIHGYSKSSMIN